VGRACPPTTRDRKVYRARGLAGLDERRMRSVPDPIRAAGFFAGIRLDVVILSVPRRGRIPAVIVTEMLLDARAGSVLNMERIGSPGLRPSGPEY